MNTMHHNGYTASIEFDERDDIFVGRLLGVNATVSFHAETVTGLRSAFEGAVAEFLRGEKPARTTQLNPADFGSLGDLHDRLLAETRDTAFPPGRRTQLAVACFAIVRDHHFAIAISLDIGLTASAFALMRPLYEAAVKGMWLAHCARDSQLEAYATGKELPNVGDLVTRLLTKSELPPVVSAHMHHIRKKYWPVLSSLTHAGHAQLKRWVKPDGVGPAYTEDEIKELVNFTAFVAVATALERERLGQNEHSMTNIAALLPKED